MIVLESRELSFASQSPFLINYESKNEAPKIVFISTKLFPSLRTLEIVEKDYLSFYSIAGMIVSDGFDEFASVIFNKRDIFYYKNTLEFEVTQVIFSIFSFISK